MLGSPVQTDITEQNGGEPQDEILIIPQWYVLQPQKCGCQTFRQHLKQKILISMDGYIDFSKRRMTMQLDQTMTRSLKLLIRKPKICISHCIGQRNNRFTGTNTTTPFGILRQKPNKYQSIFVLFLRRGKSIISSKLAKVPRVI